MTVVLALLIGFQHVFIFLMESIFWGTSKINRVFRVDPKNVEVLRLWAFNQGFYNLFLSIGIFSGLWMIYQERVLEGQAIVDFAIASVLLAGIVLAYSTKRIQSGLVQFAPAVLYFILRFFVSA